MSDVTPAGPLAVADDALRTLIANVPAFQTWVGAGSAALALPSIFVGEVGYPIAAVSIASGFVIVRTREPHTILSGAVVEIAGAATGDQSLIDIDGPQTVTSVTSNTIVFATAAADLADVYPDQAFVVPTVRPIAVVSEGNDGVNSTSVGTGGCSIYAGQQDILLEADVSSQYQHDNRNALTEARNAVGSFVQSLMETQGGGDLMWLNKAEVMSGPEFTHSPEQDDSTSTYERWRALIRVTWGLEG